MAETEKKIPIVEIMSREMIKPSSPTPHDRRTYQISCLDQFAIHYYIRCIFFYNRPFANQTQDHDIIQALKDSLSQTLTHYYPLAGKVVEDDALVLCDDSGAEFTSAVAVGDDLRQLMENPTLDFLQKLIRSDGTEKHEDPLLAVQVTRFDGAGAGAGGGGVTVGVCVSHKVTDAATLCSFLKCWSEAANMVFSGESGFKELTDLGPVLDVAPELWPPIPGFSRPSWTPGDWGKVMVKRLEFSCSSITRLKSDLTADDHEGKLGNPSRVTSIMALIWHAIMESSPSPAKHVLTLPTNIRQKMSPPLPDNTFGNILKPVAVSMVHTDNDADADADEVGVAPPLAAVRGILGLIKEGTEKVNEEYAKKRGFPLHAPFAAVFSPEADTTTFQVKITVMSSWCWFPFYEVDLGLCRPSWITCPVQPYSELVLLLDGPNNGLEVFVGLNEETMNKFEKNSTLLSFCDRVHSFL